MKFNSTFALPAVIALSYLRLPVPIFASSPTRADDSKAQGDAIRRRKRSFDKNKAAGGPLRKLMANGDTLTSNTNDIVVDTLAASVVPNLSSIGGVGEWISDLNVDGPEDHAWFGSDVSLTKSGTRFAVSTPLDATNGSNSGKVTIFDKMDDGSWDVVKEFYGEEGDRYGTNFSSSDDGKRLVIIVPGVYAWVVWEESDDGSWNQIHYGSSSDKFGPVAMSGDGMRFVAGNSVGGGNTEGIAVIFEWDEGTSEWVEIGRVGGDIAGESFASSVSMSYDGKRIVGGSPFDSEFSPAGLARVFEQQDDGEWYPMGELKAFSNPDESNQFGFCVAMSSSGDKVVVGAPYPFGSANVFRDIGDGEWEISHLLTSDYTYFGRRCSISDEGTIAIGSALGVGMFDVKDDYALLLGDTIMLGNLMYSVSLSNGGKEVGIGGPPGSGTGAGIAGVYKYNLPSPSDIPSNRSSSPSDIPSNRSSSPSDRPSNRPSSPSSRCVDSPLQFQVETVDGSFLPFFCKWAKKGENENLDCSDTGKVATHCPQACRKCGALKCSDAEGSFFKRNGKKRTCASVRVSKRFIKLCKSSSIAKTCRATCNYCESI